MSNPASNPHPASAAGGPAPPASAATLTAVASNNATTPTIAAANPAIVTTPATTATPTTTATPAAAAILAAAAAPATTTTTATATAATAIPAPILTDLKPLSNELLKLINNYLTVSPLIVNMLGATLPMVRDRLQNDINPYGGNKAELSWEIREAIRTEFTKVIYPSAPPQVLLLLLFGTEIILTNMFNPSRPFYFPGARVTAPTSDGSRRVGTTLQLRSKTVHGGPVMEAMLHLDGPSGGTFQWIQVKSLLPMTGTALPTAAEAGVSQPSSGRRGSGGGRRGGAAAGGAVAGGAGGGGSGVRRSRTGRTNRTNRTGNTTAARRAQARAATGAGTALDPSMSASNNKANRSLPPLPGALQSPTGLLASGVTAAGVTATASAQTTAGAAGALGVSTPVGIGIAAAIATTRSGASGTNKAGNSARHSAAMQIARTAAAAAAAAISRPLVGSAVARGGTHANIGGSIAGGGGAGVGTGTGGRSSGGSGGGGSRGPVVEPSAVVPTSLICALPPPRSRIVGNERPVSHSSGSLRRALDISATAPLATSAAKLRLILGIQRLIARRLVENVGMQYFVKWSGRPITEGSWESRDSLLQDVPGLVREFDIRHPEESTVVRLPATPSKRTEQKGSQTQPEKKTSDQTHDEEATLNSSDKTRNEKVQGDNSGKVGASTLDKQQSNKNTEDREREKKDETEKDKVKEKDGGKKDGDDNNKSDNNKKRNVEYVDDVSGVSIPGWVDTPIVELNISGMVLQIRRPDDYSLHNDAEAAARDGKRRQAEFKKKNIEAAVQVYSLSRTEARFAIDHGLRAHRERNQHAIPFPRGLGRVSANDVCGTPFAKRDVLLAPASWEAYLLHLGMTCKDASRDLPPWMPTIVDKPSVMSDIVDTHHQQSLTRAKEHRERARSLVRDAFRYDGLVTPPAKLFRDGVRHPPGTPIPPVGTGKLSLSEQVNSDSKSTEGDGGVVGKKRRRVTQYNAVPNNIAAKTNCISNKGTQQGRASKILKVEQTTGEKESIGLLREREAKVLEVLNQIKNTKNGNSNNNGAAKSEPQSQSGKQDDDDGMWFDAVWSCWRRTSSSSSTAPSSSSAPAPA